MISAVSSTTGSPAFAASRNSCKLCAPLGACLAFRGIEGAVPFLHGSQGCATYIRRYTISHFKEPLDIASSSFGEAAAVFGGRENLRVGLENVVRQYSPKMIGLATTCLAETIGEDVPMLVRQVTSQMEGRICPVVHVATPSFSGTHADGFRAAVRATVDALAQPGPRHEAVNLLPGIISPADLRYLKEIVADFGLESILLPDYSDTLDGQAWDEYHRMPPGGTPLEDVRRMGSAQASLELGSWGDPERSAAGLLASRFGVPHIALPAPIGATNTDRFFAALERLSGRPTPAKHRAERGRLIDSYVDAHKYVFGKRVAVYGEPDLLLGLVGLLVEVGLVPAVCATGTRGVGLREQIVQSAPELADACVLEGVDFVEVEQQARAAHCELIVGSSKGYGMARRMGIPLVRVGFPIHDRVDGPRLLHVGYRGAQQLFDRMTNALIEQSQDSSPIGYSYM